MSRFSSEADRANIRGLAFLLIGLYAYALYALAQVATFMRAEAAFSDVAAGLHATGFALGLVVSGLAGERLARRVGSHAALWGGATALAAGAAAIAIGPPIIQLTIPAAAIQGVGGGLMLALVNEILVARFRERAAAVLSGANVAGSLASLAGPVLVWSLSALGLGWRPMLLLPAVAAALGFAYFGGPRGPVGGISTATGDHARLGRSFWSRWLVLVLVIALEFATVFWAAPLLQRRLGVDAASSAAMLAWLIAGMLVGRLAGVRLSSWPTLRGQLLVAGLCVSAVGLTVVWASQTAAFSITGLLMAGAGIGVLYPEAVASAVRSAPGSEAEASARCTLGFGLALLVAPVVLGGVSDATDVLTAFALVPLLVGAAGFAVWCAHD